MVVNIDDYVSKYLEIYIFYHGEDFINRGISSMGGPLSSGVNYFNDKYNGAVSQMKQDALKTQVEAQTIYNQMKSDANKAISTVDIMQALQEGNLLEETLTSIADVLNASIEKTVKESSFIELASAIGQSSKYYGLLENGANVKANDLNEFFNAIRDAMQKANLTEYRGFVRDLNDLKAYLTGKVNRTKEFTIRNSTDLTASQKIINDLSRAANRLIKGEKGITKESFRSTVVDIFSTAIGENAVKEIVKNAIVSETDKTVLEALSKVKGLQLVDKQPREVTLSGTQHSSSGSVAKPDVLSNGIFQLKLNVGEKDIAIDLITNLSVKWYSSKMTQASQIHMVSGTPLKKYFADDPQGKYYAYNILAHSRDFDHQQEWNEGFRVMRASIAASYLNTWLTGSGGILDNGQIDRAQFIIFNGKIVPVMTIINNICDEYMKNEARSESSIMPVKLHFTGVRNDWQGAPGNDINLAVIRSEMTRKVLDALTISASFNYNMLGSYIK